MLNKQAGDTLIEVTFGIAILASLVASTYALVGLAFRTGELAKERTIASTILSEQAEALRNFRDANDWASFSSNTNSAAGFYMTASGSTWRAISPCPVGGNVNFAPGAVVCIKLVGTTGSAPNQFKEFDISVDWVFPGLPTKAHSQITYDLNDMEAF